jgi:hypothetical protein
LAQVARLLLHDRHKPDRFMEDQMTNTQTIAGAAFTVMLSALLAYTALEPVSVDAAQAAPVLAAAAHSARG